jgi:hypothetical protein
MPIESLKEKRSMQHYAGIFVLSLATLLLELSLTRVLSVALWYHFGFLVISTALLGFGTSGVVLALWRNLRERIALDRALAILSLLFGVLTIACFWLMQQIPFDPFSLLADKRQLLFMPLYYLIIAAPFFCSGLAFALLFTRASREIARLYAFDLVGAGVGCAAIALVMPSFGGSGSVVIAATVGMLASIIFGFKEAKPLAFAGGVLTIAAFTLAFFAESILPISITPNKRQRTMKPLHTEWNTFSRIDVYEQQPDSARQNPRRRIFVFDAGTAVTGMVELRSDVREFLGRNTNDSDYGSGIAYAGKERPKVLIIGSGAGRQVLDALHYGARSITAVEINPIINDLVSGRMSDFWGGLFQQPEVQLVTDEGRSFVRRSRETYDAIISVHTISNAAIASGALSLAENYVLTREAFEDYLDHLAADGVIYFTRPEAQIPRLFATAREVLEARGLANPSAHLYAFRNPPANEGRSSFFAGFLLKKSPFTPDEISRIEDLLTGDRDERTSEGNSPIEVLYSPFAYKKSIYDTLVSIPDLKRVYAEHPFQLAPATDDRPFFNQRTRWSSLNLAAFRDVFTQEKMGRFALEDRPIAEITLVMLLAQSIIIAAILIILPLAKFSREGLWTRNRWKFLLYFAGLGLGFIMIEIAFLQRFALFLGQPVYTFAVVLASLLIFTGAGAYSAERFRLQPRRALGFIVLLILAALLATAFIAPFVFSATLGLDLFWRIMVSILLIAPMGVLLGMPFPTGIRIVANEAAPMIPWAWGVNGFFTVIGAVGALMLGMAFGFKVVLALAAGCYLMALAAMMATSTSDPAS